MGFQTPIKEWTKNYKRNKNRIQNNDWLNYMEVVSNLYNKTKIPNNDNEKNI